MYFNASVGTLTLRKKLCTKNIVNRLFSSIKFTSISWRKYFCVRKFLPPSFQNDNHISFKSEGHRKPFLPIVLTPISKWKWFQNGGQHNPFWNENTFKISFQNYSHRAFQKVSHISSQGDNHLLYKSHIQIKIIVKCYLKLIYIKSIWLLKG